MYATAIFPLASVLMEEKSKANHYSTGIVLLKYGFVFAKTCQLIACVTDIYAMIFSG